MKYKVSIDIDVTDRDGFDQSDVIQMIESVIGRGVSKTCLINQSEIINGHNIDYVAINNDIIKGINKAVIVKNDTLLDEINGYSI